MNARAILIPLFISMAMHAAAISTFMAYPKAMKVVTKDPSVLVVELASPGVASSSGVNHDAMPTRHAANGRGIRLPVRRSDAGTSCGQVPQESPDRDGQKKDFQDQSLQQQAPADLTPGNDGVGGPGGGIALDASSAGDADNAGTRMSSPAELAEFARPEYPRYSRSHGEEGTVVLDVEVSADGRPVKVMLIRSSGYRRLDDAALGALEKAVFIPARNLDKPVSSSKRIAFRFTIKEWNE